MLQSFDAQAAWFGTRAGLPEPVKERIADAILILGRLTPARHVIDVGAGTGEIGLELVARGVGYLGIDESDAMLGIFRRRAAERHLTPSLLVADARDRWPVADASQHVVFGSRSLHWLAAEDVAEEALRVAAPGGAVLLVGRGVHDPAGPRERVRRAMREALREAGFEGRNGGRSTVNLLSACTARGATPIETRTVARWTVRRSPRAAIDDWRGKSGLAGIEVPPAEKSAILARVTEFAESAFANIDEPIESEECYTLEGATLTP